MSSSKNILCAISTPLQLICAIEYINSLDRNNKVHLLILASNSKIDDLTHVAFEQYGNFFSGINSINTGIFNPKKYPIKSIIDTIKTKYLINKYMRSHPDKPNLLILGHAPPYEFGHLVKKNIDAKIVIVDDGLRTLSYLTDEKYRKKDIESTGKIISADRILRFLYGSNGKYQSKSVFFTAFYDEADKLTNKCIKNSFLIIKNKAAEKKPTNEHHFLGQPLIENGIIAQNNYFDILKKISDECEGEFIYYPHPAENKENIDKIKSLNIKINRPKISYEEHIIYSEKLPKSIGSFYSSGIYTLSKILPNLNLYYIDATKYFTKKELAAQILDSYNNAKKTISIVSES